MEKSRISSLLIVSVITVLHLFLGWLLAQSTFREVEVGDLLQNLQMVDVNLELADFNGASEEPNTMQENTVVETQSSTQPAPQPQPTPIPQSEEVKTTQVDTVADRIKPPDPIKPKKPEPKPQPPEPKQLPKKPIVKVETTQSVKKPEVKANTAVPSSTASQTAADSASTQTNSANNKKPSQTTTSTTAKGSTADNRSSTQSGSNKGSTQSAATTSLQNGGNTPKTNSVTKASLGAGYGSSMSGACSDLSDEADDEGRVTLKVSVDERGKAKNVQVLSPSGLKRLDNQAKRIASKHTYSPAKSNGKAVADDVVFTMEFKCGNAA